MHVNTSGHARLFVALTLPPDVTETLVALQCELHRALAESDIRWIRRDNLHITLRFLGNVARDRISALISALRVTTNECDAPVLSCAGIGCFPSLRAPRILWARVREADESLASIVDGVRRSSEPFTTEPRDQNFTAHVTLGRCRLLPAADKHRFRDVVRALETREFGQWRAREFVLLESEHAPADGGYKILERFALGRP